MGEIETFTYSYKSLPSRTWIIFIYIYLKIVDKILCKKFFGDDSEVINKNLKKHIR